MNTTTVNIKYRPCKIGFIVRKNNMDDLMLAVGINSMLWGGIYNPIIPFETEEYTERIANDYAIDYYHAINPNDEITKFIDQHPNMYPDFLSKGVFREYDKKFAVIDVANFYEDFDSKSLNERQPLLFDWNKKRYDLLQKVLCGFYPERDDLDIDFKNKFIDGFGVDPIKITSKTKTIGVIHDRFTPISLTGIKLNSYMSLSKHGNLMHADKGIYIGNPKNINDLTYYWNLRAYGYTLEFATTDGSEFFNNNIDDFILKYDNPLDNSVWPRSLSIFYRDVNKGHWSLISDKIKGQSLHHQLHNSALGILRYTQPASFYCNQTGNCLAHINQVNKSYQVSFNLTNTPVKESDTRDTTKQIYVASIDLEGEPFYRHTLNLPFLPELNRFYRQKIIGRFKIDELKSENIGLGMIITNQIKSLTISPIHFHDIIFEMLLTADLKPEASQAGVLTNQVINKLGHIDSCRVFKITGVRKLFKSLKVDDSIIRSHITQKIYDDDSFKRFERLYIEKRENPKLTTAQVVDYLFRHDFFRAGLTLKCHACFLENWIPVKRLDDYWNCEYCGNTNQLNTDLNNRGDWKFRKSGLFGKDNNQEGAIPVILTLLLFYRTLQDLSKHQSLIYETAIKFEKPDNCEVDFFIVNCRNRDDFEVGFGECKDSGGNINQQDMDNLKIVYNKLKAKYYRPHIIISKAADTFSDEEIALFKLARKEEYRLILLTSKELEPYYLYENYDNKEQIPRSHPFSLNDMAWNSNKLYLGE